MTLDPGLKVKHISCLFHKASLRVIKELMSGSISESTSFKKEGKSIRRKRLCSLVAALSDEARGGQKGCISHL